MSESNNILLKMITKSVNLGLKSSKKLMLTRLCTEIVLVFIPFILIYLNRDLINKIVSQKNNLREITLFIIVILLIETLKIILDNTKKCLVSIQNDIVRKLIDVEVSSKAADLDLKYFDSTTYYDDMMNAKRDSNVIITSLWLFLDLLFSMIRVIISFIMLSKMNLILTLLYLVMYIPVVIIERKYTKEIYKWQLNKMPEERKMDYLKNILTSRQFAFDSRLYNYKEHIIERFISIWKKWFSIKKKILVRYFLILNLFNIMPKVIISVFLFDISKSIVTGTVQIGEFYLIVGLLATLTFSIQSLINNSTIFYDNKNRYTKYLNFLELESLIKDEGELVLDNILKIEFKNVMFKYPDTADFILKECSFCIKKNQKIAIVGANGAGKSTIIKLLLRFYETTSGDIEINVLNICMYSIESIRSKFSSLFQETATYAFTVKENITISEKFQDNQEHLNQAIIRSDFSSTLSHLHDGINTNVTREYEDNGKEFSVGQKQKIAIARSLYRKCQVYIFDEPSSSLDPISEMAFYENIISNRFDGTVIYISHRFANVSLTDNIFFIDDGKVIEEGTHSELSEIKGRYYKFYKTQSDRYDKPKI